MVAASSLYGVTDTKSELAPDLPVDKQDNQRTDHRDGETAEVKAIDLAKTEQRTDPAADYRADNTQYYGDDKPTAIFARHDTLRQNTRNKPKDNPG